MLGIGDSPINSAREMADHEQAIYRLAGREFNINSPRQLGEVFFEHLKLLDKRRKPPPAVFTTSRRLVDLRLTTKRQRLLD